MSLLASPSRLRLAGRSFLAFVLEPSRPLDAWFADLDQIAEQSSGFFANRPVVLNLGALKPSKAETGLIIDALAARAIRVIAVEGIDPAWTPGLTPLAGGVESARVVETPGAPPSRPCESPSAPRRPAAGLVIDRPIRSGESIFHADGDVTVIGAVASGAELIAGGSIHIHGAIRGRAFAGATGNADARIFCRKFEAELVAIDGCYLAAENYAPSLIGRSIQVRLKNEAIIFSVLG